MEKIIYKLPPFKNYPDLILMAKIFFLFLITLYVCPVFVNAQDEDYQIGLNQNYIRQSAGGYYDYADPDGINIKVAVWGYVKYPGKYVVPKRSDIKDLISYAGGVDDNAYLDDIRIYRVDGKEEQKLIRFDYEDLWWGEGLKTDLDISRLEAGDILIVPGRNRLYWENYFTLILSSLGFLISLATLIITASK